MPKIGYKQTKEHKKKDGRSVKKCYCVDCGKKIYYTSKRCCSCKIITEKRNGKNNSSYIDGRTLKKYYCIDCGKELINIYAKRCHSCANKIKMKKKWQNPEFREKIMRVRNTIEYREKMKKKWQDGKMDGVFMSPTKPEKQIMKVLEKLKVDYIFQFRPKNYSKIYDFYISDINLLIEFDGVYWHSLIEVRLRDIEKTEYAENNGYNLLRFNENNLDSFESLILEKIKKEENYART